MISGLSRLRLVILAIFAVAGVSLVGPGGVGASAPHAIAIVAHAVRWTSARHDAHPEECAARPAIERDAVVVDLADDDLDDDDLEHGAATRPHFATESTPPFRGDRLSRRPSRDLRGHPQFDRPRFLTGRGLLRGPPA